MKSSNFEIDMMVPDQRNRDIIFNESILKIDQFLNICVSDWIDEPKSDDLLKIGEKYIVKSGEYKDYICYLTHQSQKIKYLKPKAGMCFFLLKTREFFFYENTEWKKIQSKKSNLVKYNFTNMSGKFMLQNESSLYLYVNGDSEIIPINIQLPEVTIIIKQNYQSVYNVNFSSDVIWSNKKIYKTTKQTNAMDLVKLYKLPNEKYFLGKIINQNYQY